MTSRSSVYRTGERLLVERERLLLQETLDSGKSSKEKNRLGQFATPTQLAQHILQQGMDLLGEGSLVRFLDPAIGTGSFFSALLSAAPPERIQIARGFEIDPYYGVPSQSFWANSKLEILLEDFTAAEPPPEEEERFNLLICNPPYVRHHHIKNGNKARLQARISGVSSSAISGLAGLYCYFMLLSHHWMQKGGIAGWLVPSEFMDVNYGTTVKDYLLDKVTLLQIHRFAPHDVQFGDAVVSSAVVWFRNGKPPQDLRVPFTYGGTLSEPQIERAVTVRDLRGERKWTRFPAQRKRRKRSVHKLADLFAIKRGLATGANSFFIMSESKVTQLGLPEDVVRPILPSPRSLESDEVESRSDGIPLLPERHFLLDCRMREEEVMKAYPTVWAYLEQGRRAVADGYLCRSRKPWYSQEDRPPAPILCTYLGRRKGKSGHPFRFILNNSQATATNVYLLLYPHPPLARAAEEDPSLYRAIWDELRRLSPEDLLQEGRVYGGGLHKLEPRELGNVPIDGIAARIPRLRGFLKAGQLELL